MQITNKTINNVGGKMDYKIFLKSLSWDEFQTYLKNVDKSTLSEEQKEILQIEAGERAYNYNRWMSF